MIADQSVYAGFLATEQIANARRLNRVRCVSGAAFLVLSVTLHLAGIGRSGWQDDALLGGYFLGGAVLLAVGRRSDGVAQTSRLAVPFLDLPLVFLVQWIGLAGSDNPRAVANFTLAIFIALIMLSALSLEQWQILLTAAMAAALQALLYRRAEETLYGGLSALVLIAASAGVCGYARRRRIDMVWDLCAEQLRRERLGRYFSPAVARVIERTHEGLDLTQNTEVTVLFSDLRDFTTLAERLDTREIVALLNEYFEQMVQVVFDHGGTLDKYLGDGMMAYFGAPVAQEDHASRAVACALAMQTRLAEFNARRLSDGMPAVRMGIGIHTGLAIIGSIGAFHRREYTAIGDTVNVASRIEGLCKAFDTDILISADTAARAPEAARFTRLGAAAVKGRVGEVDVLKIEMIG